MSLFWRPSRARVISGRWSGGSLPLTPGYVSLAPPGPSLLVTPRGIRELTEIPADSLLLIRASLPLGVLGPGGAPENSPGLAQRAPGSGSLDTSRPGGAREGEPSRSDRFQPPAAHLVTAGLPAFRRDRWPKAGRRSRAPGRNSGSTQSPGRRCQRLCRGRRTSG